MAQHDYIISNASGAAVRADLNNALAATVSNNSAGTSPSTTYPYMWWADTTTNKLKLRNSANNGWNTICELDGTMLIEDGTVSAPGLAFESDQNTGLFRSAADTLAIATAGTQRVTVDSAGNVGIGNGSPAASLQIQKTSAGGDPTHLLLSNVSSSSGTTSSIYFAPNLVGATRAAKIAGINEDGGNSTALTFFTNPEGNTPTERLRIDSSGKLLAGKTSTSASNALLQVASLTGAQLQLQCAQAGAAYALFQNTVTGDAETDGLYVGTDGSNNGYLYNYEAGQLIFGTSNAQRMLIDSSGKVGIGTTTPAKLLHLFGDGANANMLSQQNPTSAVNHISFTNNNGEVGTISTSGSSTAFNTSSDYRLKENVVDIADGITRVKQLTPRRFNFIADDTTTVDGFIAHEAQTVVPEAVTGEKDGEEMQGIDQSKLVPLLTAALQEAIAKIEILETKVAALEAG
mgnify:CR=1 FL=1